MIDDGSWKEDIPRKKRIFLRRVGVAREE